MKVNTVEIRVPGFYNNLTHGLCANNNKEITDDYTTKEGEVLEFPPQFPNYSRYPSEEISATSWITGSADLRGCLPYEVKPELVTENLRSFDPGPGPDVRFDCDVTIQQECEDLINAKWLEECTLNLGKDYQIILFLRGYAFYEVEEPN